MTVEQKLDAFMREMVKALALTMADVQALKTLHAAHQPNGAQTFQMAFVVAMQEYQPILDSLQQASDEKLLDALKGLKGPVH
jgi:hypothetical protein